MHEELTYLSVCSGIEAATVAWEPLGWRPAAFAEIEAFPSAVLAHHYPDTPNHGDFTTIEGDDYGSVDLLVGGTPCQAFSVAGLRAGLADDRGQLTLEFARLASRLRPTWIVWENVPGVLSQDEGRAFGSFLGALAELGYGFAYRVLDAQHFGVPQRRRRVFVVGHLGDWRPAAAVLFESHSLQGHSPPSREAGEAAPGELAHCPLVSGTLDKGTPARSGSQAGYIDQMIAHTLRGNGFDASEDGTGRGTPLVVGALCHGAKAAGSATQQAAEPGQLLPMAFDLRGREGGAMPEGPHDTANIRAASGGSSRSYIAEQWTVRRLTPRECERLQGFPDDYTQIPWRGKGAEDCPDGPRYKALGNSMAVPVMQWIGGRIQMVREMMEEANGR